MYYNPFLPSPVAKENLQRSVRFDHYISGGTLHDLFLDSIPQSLALRQKLLAFSPFGCGYDKLEAVRRAEKPKTTLFYYYEQTKDGDAGEEITTGPDEYIVKAVLKRMGFQVRVRPIYPPDILAIVKTQRRGPRK